MDRRCVWHLLLSLLLIPYAWADEANLPVTVAQGASFLPITKPDGVKRWWFTTAWPIKGDAEALLTTYISAKMGEKNWCPLGWAVESRRVEGKSIILEGRCLTASASQ